MLEGLFASIYGDSIPLAAFLAASAVSLLLGGLIALCYRKAVGTSGTMGGALTLLPFLVQVVILLVNGNLGAGVAVAGAFSLVRFRSAPGTARDITAIFLAMTVGLACGMGYLTLGVFAAVIVCVVMLMMKSLSPAVVESDRDLKITIPESLDYSSLFDDLMDQYTSDSALINVKTTNLGSLYCLHYRIQLKNTASEKEFIDHLRCRNGNLDISCGRISTAKDIL
ncbi:hypothetical protein OBV_29940 [Oscillibacter valericigenes Sjm18-20]|nr:hypothetical protein OBV_29940 [Oscillibacter valericigenes Sjm18-20]